jgi:hypothetical protein
MKINNFMNNKILLGAVLTAFALIGVTTARIETISAAVPAAMPTPTPVPVRTPLGNKTKIKNQSEIKELPLINRTVFNNLGINAKRKKKAARRVVRRHRSN